MNKKLGTGLATLLGNKTINNSKMLQSSEDSHFKIQELSIDLIIGNLEQPRKFFNEDKLIELANSIEENGLIQPITVVKSNDKYKIVAGERRFRAMQLIKKDKIPVIIIDANENEIFKKALIENIQRENLSPIEEARGYRKMTKELNFTQDQVAKELGKSRAHIANMIRLLNLPSSIQDRLNIGEISVGHAKVLLTTEDPEKYISDILNKNLSVRNLEEFIKNENQDEYLNQDFQSTNKIKASLKNDHSSIEDITYKLIDDLYRPLIQKHEKDLSIEEFNEIEKNIKSIEKMISEIIKMNVKLKITPNSEKGIFSIEYQSLKQLEKIIKSVIE